METRYGFVGNEGAKNPLNHHISPIFPFCSGHYGGTAYFQTYPIISIMVDIYHYHPMLGRIILGSEPGRSRPVGRCTECSSPGCFLVRAGAIGIWINQQKDVDFSLYLQVSLKMWIFNGKTLYFRCPNSESVRRIVIYRPRLLIREIGKKVDQIAFKEWREILCDGNHGCNISHSMRG